MEKKLKVKYSTFKSPLTYSEWTQRYKVGSMYTEPTRYFTGHLSDMSQPQRSTMFQSVEGLFPKVSLKQFIINKFKKKKDA